VVGSCDSIHLCCDFIEKCPAIIAVQVDVEVRPAGQESEMRLAIKLAQGRLQAVRRTIQIERVVGANDQVDLPSNIGANRLPAGLRYSTIS